MTTWVGPFRLRDLLEHAMDNAQPWPQEEAGVYVVSLQPWEKEPTETSGILYVGSNTKNPELFLKRVGDLIIDMLGFWGDKENSGHHSGGRTLYNYCRKERIHPLDLFLGWQQGITCARCAENDSYWTLKPMESKKAPARCFEHQT
jgi:hypothetical protein